MPNSLKVVNIMNFVRRIDERKENSTEKLLAFTAEQLRLVNRYPVDNTFLLQYDALCDEDFVTLFKTQATDRTELGLWYEIVEPLTSACGIPYRSEMGWKWDWHIIPGFSMAYSPQQREKLIDEAMRKFKEVFGCYPKTVGSWVLDTHTLNYLADHYEVSAAAICRDQANTDAYTLLGGYFNGAYYPSRQNIFTPAQTRENQNSIPVFRLLGPCPIHNYDNHKYSSQALKDLGHKSICFTLEPVLYIGSVPEVTRWMFDCYYSQESLHFAYAQIGQENSFFPLADQVLAGLEMQIKQLLARGDVEFRKMGDTGDLFKARFPEETPPASVVALQNFDTPDVQSVYYNCKNYTANLFRFEDRVFLRSFFLFDEKKEDLYIRNTCTTFDAIYENLPLVDTMTCPDEDRKCCGLLLGTEAQPFSVEAPDQDVLTVKFGEKAVTFFPDRVEVCTDSLLLYANSMKGEHRVSSDGISFLYKNTPYRLDVSDAVLSETPEGIRFAPTGGPVTLHPAQG